MPLSRQEIAWKYYSNGAKENNIYEFPKTAYQTRRAYQQPAKSAEVKYLKPQKKLRRRLNWRGKLALAIIATVFLSVIASFFLIK